MKIVYTNYQRSAMSRVGILGLIGVAVVAAYLVGRYQETGELFQTSWRKKVDKTNSVVRPNSALEMNSVDEANVSEEILVANTNAVSTRVLTTAKSTTTSTAAEISGTRLTAWQNKKVLIPTNAVWSPTPRKKPGVRIAFP